MKLIFGSRGSDLALAQTQAVINRLTQAFPDTQIETRIIRTTGDNRPDARLEDIGGLGAFTREIEQALLGREIDAAVHSLKDLPTKQPAGLAIAAVAGRERPNDALISADGCTLETLPECATVGTSSLRRKAQLLARRPDLRIRELRGNVPTRLRQVSERRLDAVLLAAAGLIRLGLDKTDGIWEIPIEEMLPAPGQGALALETRADDAPVIALLEALHDAEAAVATQCERAVLQAFGGGCRAPLGVYARLREGRVHLQVFAADMDTGRTVCLSREAATGDAARLGAEAGAWARAELTMRTTPRQTKEYPLRDKRIVVTRARHQAASFGGLLEAAGARVFYLPLIKITPLPDAPLPEPDTPFDWLIFTSANAVRAFGEVLARNGRNASEYGGSRVAAIGDATAAAAKALGLHVDIVPNSHTSDALIKALLRAEPQPSGKTALLPQSSAARAHIADHLEKHGMKTRAFTAYKTDSCDIDDGAAADLVHFAPECVAFFSPSAVKAYISTGLREKLAQTSPSMLYASIGPVTTEALRRAGCAPVVEAPRQSEDALRDALIAVLSQSP